MRCLYGVFSCIPSRPSQSHHQASKRATNTGREETEHIMSCSHHLPPHRLPGARRKAAVDSARSRAPRALLLADARACLKSCSFAWSSSLGCAPCCCAPRAQAGAVPSACLVTSVCWRRFESACAVGSSWAQGACLPIFADSARARARAARHLASPPGVRLCRGAAASRP